MTKVEITWGGSPDPVDTEATDIVAGCHSNPNEWGWVAKETSGQATALRKRILDLDEEITARTKAVTNEDGETTGFQVWFRFEYEPEVGLTPVVDLDPTDDEPVDEPPAKPKARMKT